MGKIKELHFAKHDLLSKVQDSSETSPRWPQSKTTRSLSIFYWVFNPKNGDWNATNLYCYEPYRRLISIQNVFFSAAGLAHRHISEFLPGSDEN
jgi:hypothetical protein